MLKVQRIKLGRVVEDQKQQTNQEGNENEMQKYKKDLKKEEFKNNSQSISNWREECYGRLIKSIQKR